LGIYDKGINVSDWNCGCNERWFALWSRLGGYNGVIFSPKKSPPQDEEIQYDSNLNIGFWQMFVICGKGFQPVQ